MSSRTARAPAGFAHSGPIEARLRELLEQQAALRELAIAVAEMRAPEVIYELVAKEAAGVAGVDAGAVVRFRVDGVGEVVGSWRMGGRQTGSLIPLDSTAGVAIVVRTGRSARANVTEASDAQQPGRHELSTSVTLLWGRCRPDPRTPGAVGLPARRRECR